MKQLNASVVIKLCLILLMGLFSSLIYAQETPSATGAICDTVVPTDIVVLFDTSASIEEETLPASREFLSELISDLQLSDGTVRVAVLTFNDAIRSIVPLTDDIEAVESGLARITTTSGQTDISAALSRAKGELLSAGRFDANSYIIIITDGDDNSDALQIAQEIINSEVTIIAVGAGEDRSFDRLEEIASEQHFFQVSNYEALNDIREALVLTTSCAEDFVSDGAGGVMLLETTPEVTLLQATEASPIATETPVEIISTPPSDADETLAFLSFIPEEYRLPALIIAILLFILLLFLLMRFLSKLFGNKNIQASSPNREEENPGVSGRGPRPNYDPHRNTYPGNPSDEPYARLHQSTLVIGIGDSGAKILDDLVNRVDDTNLIGYISDGEDDKPDPKLMLLHLQMSTVNDRAVLPENQFIGKQEVISCLDLDKSSTIYDSSYKENGWWEWARLADVERLGQVGRHSARVVLFNDLNFGEQASILLPKLKTYVDRAEPVVYIVGAAKDTVGANIMGDIAALLRYCNRNLALHIHTLVAGEENHLPFGTDSSQEAYLSATIYELGRLNTPARLRIQYGPSIYYENPARESLLNSFNLFYGENDAGTQSITNLIWGKLTDEAFTKLVDNLIQPDNKGEEETPSLSVTYTHSLIWPLRVLRDLLASRLMVNVIGPNELPRYARIPTRENMDEATISEELDYARRDGLLPQIALLSSLPGHNNYLFKLQSLLDEVRRKFEKKEHKLKRYQRENSHYMESYEIPLNLEDWDQSDFKDSEHLEMIANRASWAAQLDRDEFKNPPVRLAISPPQGHSPDQNSLKQNDLVRNSNNLKDYTEAIEQVVTFIVHNQELAGIAARFPDTLSDNDKQDVKNNWVKRFRSWNSEYAKRFNTADSPLQIQRFNLGVPDTWSVTEVKDIKYLGDVTFAMQGMIIARTPIQQLRQLDDTRAQLALTQHLIYEQERVTLDVFGGDIDLLRKIPVTLQNELTRRNAMWKLYQCWLIDQQYTFENVFGYTGDAKFRDLAIDFIHDYERDQGKLRAQVEDYLAENEEKLAAEPEPEIFTSDGTPFGDYLMQAFERFTSQIDTMKYYPPTES